MNGGETIGIRTTTHDIGMEIRDGAKTKDRGKRVMGASQKGEVEIRAAKRRKLIMEVNLYHDSYRVLKTTERSLVRNMHLLIEFSFYWNGRRSQ